MILSHEIVAAVDQITTAQVPPITASAADGRYQLLVTVLLAGPVGLECTGVVLESLEATNWSVEDLEVRSHRLASRLTYLMEPITVLELDAVGPEAILRSRNPTARHGLRSFFEIRVNHRGSLSLRRIAVAEDSGHRYQTSFQLTREVLERMVEDMVIGLE